MVAHAGMGESYCCSSIKLHKVLIGYNSFLPGQLEAAVFHIIIYPVRACAARGKVISRGWWCPYIYKSTVFFGTNLLSPKILTLRGLF